MKRFKMFNLFASIVLVSAGLSACADNDAQAPTSPPVNSSADIDECPRADGQPCK